MPSARLQELLRSIGLSDKAMDCAVNPINDLQNLLTNIDIFTPIHDDPYIMGKIAACNVTNDLFAMNAPNVLNYSAFLGLPKDIPSEFPSKMMQGQIDFLKALGTTVHGGHTIINPWPLLGGSASSVVFRDHMIQKTGVKENDKLILTKPQGIQAIMAAYRILYSDPSWLDDFDKSHINKSIDLAVKQMITSNYPVVQTIYDGLFYKTVHAMTDITGFGLNGHLMEMLDNRDLGAIIDLMPIIPLTQPLSELFGFRIEEAKTAETAGAMLMSVDSEVEKDFTQSLTDHHVWWRSIGKISSQVHGIKFSDSLRWEEITDY